MANDNIRRCPKCGYPDIYMGAFSIECGYDTSCPNWTKTQSDEVEKLNAERYPGPDYSVDTTAQSQESKTEQQKDSGDDDDDDLDFYAGLYQYGLNYDDDDDTPTWTVLSYDTD